jgi:hypothetical protein
MLENRHVMESPIFQPCDLDKSVMLINLDVLRIHEEMRMPTEVVYTEKLDIDVKDLENHIFLSNTLTESGVPVDGLCDASQMTESRSVMPPIFFAVKHRMIPFTSVPNSHAIINIDEGLVIEIRNFILRPVMLLQVFSLELRQRPGRLDRGMQLMIWIFDVLKCRCGVWRSRVQTLEKAKFRCKGDELVLMHENRQVCRTTNTTFDASSEDTT